MTPGTVTPTAAELGGDVAGFAQALTKGHQSQNIRLCEPGLSHPTIGNADCCARAASGHAAAAPPSAASNSRRLMVTVMRPSRARGLMQRYHATSALSYNGAAPAGQGRLDLAISGDAIQ